MLKVSEDQEFAAGRVYAFRKEDWTQYKSDIRYFFEEKCNLFEDEKPLHADFNKKFNDAICFEVKCKVWRDGVCSLSDPTISSLEFTDSKEKIEHCLTAQAFFYLRDILHNHKFHAPSSDTITDVYETREAFIEGVNQGLMRRILSTRRMSDALAKRKSAGLLTYLNAFRENVMSEQERQKHKFSIEHLSAALEAEYAVSKDSETKSFRAKIEDFRKFLFGFLALLTAYASLFKDSKNLISDNLFPLKLYVESFQENFIFSIISLSVIILFAQILLSPKLKRRDHILRNMSRFAISTNVKIAGMVQIAFGIVLVVLSFYTLGHIFHSILQPQPWPTPS